jgi:hypothetical protein
MRFEVRASEVVVPGVTWVYAWCETADRPARVVYVGATRLHPAARAEKHLRDPDPEVGRIRARFAAAGGDLAQPLTVHAVAIEEGGRRALVKARAIALLSDRGLLSPRWCGDAPAAPAETLTENEEARAQVLVAALR